MIKLTKEQQEAVEQLQSNRDGIKALKLLFKQKKEEKITACQFAKNKDIIIKSEGKDIVLHETASEEIKGNLAFIDGMDWILKQITK